MKAELDPAIRNLRGSAGNFIYRKIRGRTVLSPKPVDIEPTPGQLAQRERFAEAAQYGKSVLAEPDIRALYEAEAERRDVPIFSVMVADFFKAPKIKAVDVSGYNGQPGSPILIKAVDDFGVVSVHVSIFDPQGTLLEQGTAVQTGAVSIQWTYTTTATIPADTFVTVRVVATDRPGGTAIEAQVVAF